MANFIDDEAHHVDGLNPNNHRRPKRYRNYCFTLNNWSPEQRQAIISTCEAKPNIRWLTMGEETGEAGTPHLQGAFSLVNNTTMAACHKWPGFERMALLEMRGTTLQNEIYCEKECTNVYTYGIRPLTAEEKGNAEIDRWKTARAAAREGRYDDVDDEIILRHPGGIRFVRQHYMESREVDTLMGPLHNRMFWYWGQSRSGKTYEAAERMPGYYKKALNKWWCGYNDHDYVVVEDVDPTHASWIASFLKYWTDRVPFMAERKQGNLCIRPKYVIITSQYPINKVFQDPETVEALSERCKQIEFIKPMVPWPDNMYDPKGIRLKFNEDGQRVVNNIHNEVVLWEHTKHYREQLDYTKHQDTCFAEQQ